MVRLLAWQTAQSLLGPPSPLGEAEPNGVLRGFREYETYKLRVDGEAGGRLYIDDIECHPSADEANTFLWRTEFYAGVVTAVYARSGRPILRFQLEVAPDSLKSSVETFGAMLDEVRQHDPALLLGSTPAGAAFGTQSRRVASRLAAMVRFERLKRYGQEFLDAAEQAVSGAHQALQHVSQQVPLSRVRRLSPAAYRSSRVVAAILAHDVESTTEEEKEPFIRSVVVRGSSDTPANRVLKALLIRFLSMAELSSRDVAERALLGDASEQEVREAQRRKTLEELTARTRLLLRSEPFPQVAHTVSSGAGLTHVAVLPKYSRAFRIGMRALRSGFASSSEHDELPLVPTYAVYEAWCFVALAQAFKNFLGIPAWQQRSWGGGAGSPLLETISADSCLAGELDGSRRFYLLFQPTFLSVNEVKSSPDALARSVSGQRRPDFVAAVVEGAAVRFMPLDSKYKAKPANVLGALETAHVYQDSLRLANQRPTRTLLLCPGAACLGELHNDTHWDKEGIGVVADVRPGGTGVDTLVRFVSSRLCSERKTSDV
ncbi:MAG: DUF2357 domain-containing protein [Burkholderiaceae bacterium]|jgi:hypothetical protein|nr:DUF2357 domain-containing protein [Burkholderiaceae bacterium]